MWKEMELSIERYLEQVTTEQYFAFVVIAITIAIFLIGRVALSSKKADTILLVGLNGAGKTSLFYQLRDGSTHEGTVTSMDNNADCFILHSEISKKGKIKPVNVVDIPGHLRLRTKIDEFLPQAAGIVFLLDASDFMPNMRSIAEYLYDILTKALVARKKIPTLIVCNKMDRVTAHSVDFIRKQLEREIDKLRATRTAISDADIGSEVSLGVEGEPFKFTQCANKVSATEASVISGNLVNIELFIREHVKP